MPVSPAEPGSVDLANQITGSAEAGTRPYADATRLPQSVQKRDDWIQVSARDQLDARSPSTSAAAIP
jgi:hypothetical protein